VDTGTIALIAVAVAAGGLVQGLTGLGFALVAAPVVTQLVSGTGGVGLVNALSITQNIWLIARTEGRIAWEEIRRMAPGLVAGVLLGWLILRNADPRLYDVIVAASALGSVIWLLLAGRFRSTAAGALSAIWGATVNTVAGVGGPPIAAYLVTRGLNFSSYLRSLQVVFAALSLVSLPLLGVVVPSWWAMAIWVVALISGSACGEYARRRFDESATQRIGRGAIVVVCVVAFVRAVAALPAAFG
jgi:uncharacterized membrane protein YfcA